MQLFLIKKYLLKCEVVITLQPKTFFQITLVPHKAHSWSSLLIKMYSPLFFFKEKNVNRSFKISEYNISELQKKLGTYSVLYFPNYVLRIT